MKHKKARAYDKYEQVLFEYLLNDYKQKEKAFNKWACHYTIFYTRQDVDMNDNDLKYLRSQFPDGEVYYKDGSIIQILDKHSGFPRYFTEEEQIRISSIKLNKI